MEKRKTWVRKPSPTPHSILFGITTFIKKKKQLTWVVRVSAITRISWWWGRAELAWRFATLATSLHTTTCNLKHVKAYYRDDGMSTVEINKSINKYWIDVNNVITIFSTVFFSYAVSCGRLRHKSFSFS